MKLFIQKIHPLFRVVFLGFLGTIIFGGMHLSNISLADGNQRVSGRFNEVLNEVTQTIIPHIDAGPEGMINVESSVFFLIKKTIEVLFPIIVVLGVLVAIIGLYKYFTSDDPKNLQDALRMIIFGVIGILLMFSASYLSKVIFQDMFMGALGSNFSPVELAQKIYVLLVAPFVKIAVYLSLGFLAVILISRVISYIFSTDEGVKKKLIGLILRTIVGMLIIIASKQLVEAVYGSQVSVLNNLHPENMGEIGAQVLEYGNIPIFYQIINWALSLVSFVIVLMIIIQTFKLLNKPEDASTVSGLKKTILYSLIGILVIGGAYIISNLLVIN